MYIYIYIFMPPYHGLLPVSLALSSLAYSSMLY